MSAGPARRVDDERLIFGNEQEVGRVAGDVERDDAVVERGLHDGGVDDEVRTRLAVAPRSTRRARATGSASAAGRAARARAALRAGLAVFARVLDAPVVRLVRRRERELVGTALEDRLDLELLRRGREEVRVGSEPTSLVERALRAREREVREIELVVLVHAFAPGPRLERLHDLVAVEGDLEEDRHLHR